MHIRILGTAAGGGFPQWNCGCENCNAVRRGTFPGKARSQAQLAVSADGVTWFLAGASPDLRTQIESFPALHPGGLRQSPIAGVVLAGADLDHVLGLLLLREFQPLRVYSTTSVLRILREQNSMFRMLNRVEKQVEWSPVEPGAAFCLVSAAGQSSGLSCRMLPLRGRYPKYADAARVAPQEAVCGLIFESSAGKRAAYVPAAGDISDELLAAVTGSELLLLDGTFWSDDEPGRVLGGGESARQMGHVPVQDTLRRLRDVNVGRKMFIHINNTNPMLNEAGPEFRAVHEAGWEIAEDGWRVDL